MTMTPHRVIEFDRLAERADHTFRALERLAPRHGHPVAIVIGGHVLTIPSHLDFDRAARAFETDTCFTRAIEGASR